MNSSTEAWRLRAERAEDAVRRVRELVNDWVVSDEQLADTWLQPGVDPKDVATMVLMAKATNQYGEQIISALDGVAPLGNSARVRNVVDEEWRP